MNNLFEIASRDHLEFAGGVKTSFAEEEIQQQSSKGSIRMLAGEKLLLESLDGTVIQSKTAINVISPGIKMDGLNICITCRNTAQNNVIGGGSFTVMVPNGCANIAADFIGLSGKGLNLVTDNNAMSLGGDLVINGDILLNGGLVTQTKSVDYTVVNPTTGKPDKKTVAAGVVKHLISTEGDLRAGGIVTAENGVYTLGNLAAGAYVCRTNAKSKDHILKCSADHLARAVSLADTKTNIEKAGIRIAKNSVNEQTPTDFTETGFRFDLESAACSFTLPVVLPKGIALTNTGYKGITEKTEYIYPGEGFWKSDGIYDKELDTTYGFERLSVAKPNTKKKGN